MDLQIKYYTIVDDYLVQDEILGKGRFGNIMSTINKSTKQKNALKVLEKSEKAKKEILLQLKSSLNCINIIKIFDVFETQLHYYLVMES